MSDLSLPIIETQGLRRDFKKTRAVDRLNLVIQSGELFGLVGPDGAGKTVDITEGGPTKKFCPKDK